MASWGAAPPDQFGQINSVISVKSLKSLNPSVQQITASLIQRHVLWVKHFGSGINLGLLRWKSLLCRVAISSFGSQKDNGRAWTYLRRVSRFRETLENLLASFSHIPVRPFPITTLIPSSISLALFPINSGSSNNGGGLLIPWHAGPEASGRESSDRTSKTVNACLLKMVV